MPQLDKVHFLSQYFWLCVFYFGFYFLVTKHFLPRMARILQFRKNKCTLTPGADQELNLVKESGNTALINVFSLSQKFWSGETQRMDRWYANALSFLECLRAPTSNKLYIKSVGNYSLRQNAVVGGIPLALPRPSTTWLFTHKLKLGPKAALSYAVGTPSSDSSGLEGSLKQSHRSHTSKSHTASKGAQSGGNPVKKDRQKKDKK